MSAAPARADVLVIGAGIHGVTAAYHLALRGVSVSVVDRAGVAEGPTGAASGVVRAYYTNPFLAEVAHGGIARLAEIEQTPSGSAGHRTTGGLYLHGPEEVAAVEANVLELAVAGVPAELMVPAEVGRRFPGISTDGVGVAVWEPGAGIADPALTARSYAQRLTALRVPLHLGDAVIRIEEQASAVRVTTSSGRVHEAGQVLITAGPWTAPLAAQVGADLPLVAERHVVAGFSHRPGDVAEAVDHVLIDVVGGYYSRPWGDDGYVLGPLAATVSSDPDQLDPLVTASESLWLADRATSRTPVRGRAQAAHSWASLYDVSPDWQPVIGQISERTYVDAGTSGHGFKLAPMLGEHVARLLLGDADPRLAQFSPARFAEGAELSSGFGAARILG